MILVDKNQIKKLSRFFRDNRNYQPFPFTGEIFPPVGHPLTVKYFFTLCKHQFGFWYDDKKGYAGPMISEIDGKKYKGSDYVWKAGVRAMEECPEFFDEKFQKDITPARLLKLFRDDKGSVPLPLTDKHLLLMKSYGMDMTRFGLTPEGLLKESLNKKSPAEFIRKKLSKVGGYKEDPLLKKLNMLIMILQNRPEKFLPREDIPPIVDYHIQRLSLRTGIVRIKSPRLEKKINERLFVTSSEERAIRKAVYDALVLLKKSASVGTNEIDWLFFSGRKYCPEMQKPHCGGCILSGYCAKLTGLFQPVFRTTYY